jgi:hypothetical protein
MSNLKAAVVDGDRVAVKRAAAALDATLWDGASADAYLLAGAWYVVTLDTGEGYDYAYEIRAVDPNEISHTSPVNNREVAVAYYLDTDGGELVASGGGHAVLSTTDQALIDLVLVVQS